jgi:DNA invertase Pin-like site-specific DNA recombinase
MDVSKLSKSAASTWCERTSQSTPSPPQGKLFVAVLAAPAQFERDLIHEHTRDSLAANTARGQTAGASTG